MEIALRLVLDKEPQELPIEDLGSLLSVLSKALQAADPTISAEYKLHYSMIALKAGSTEVACVANDTYIGEQQVRKLSKQMADPHQRRAVQPFSNLQKECNRMNTKILVFPGQSTVPSLQLAPEMPPEDVSIRGLTTIYGVLERIGGSHTTSASIRQFGHDRITSVLLTKDLAVRMARFLYREVRVEGEAEWDTGSLELLRLSATDFEPYNPGRMGDALEMLASLTKRGLWEDTGQTIADFLRDLRGGSGDWD
jgi:hypothetical protein